MDSVTTGPRTDQQNRIPDPAGFAQFDLIFFKQTDAKRINQRIAAITGIKVDFTPDGRDADRITVTGNPGTTSRQNDEHGHPLRGQNVKDWGGNRAGPIVKISR